MTTKLYKVLVDGKSCHGGNYSYPLPVNNEPGEWTPIIENPVICISGYHLTAEPHRWYKWGCDVYEAEGRGLVSEQATKSCWKSVRLLKKEPEPQWVIDTAKFVNEARDIVLSQPDGNPNPEWKLSQDKESAIERIYKNEEWGWQPYQANYSSVTQAISDNGLFPALCELNNQLHEQAKAKFKSPEYHILRRDMYDYLSVLLAGTAGFKREYIERRMEVWRKGYVLYMDIKDRFYVFPKNKWF